MGRDGEHLLDILESARLARDHVRDVTRRDFLRNAMLQDAVIRRIEIIGEAAGRLSPAFRAAHPEIPWAEIRGMRNRMIHVYDDIDMEVVWETVARHVPRLVPRLERLVPPEAE